MLNNDHNFVKSPSISRELLQEILGHKEYSLAELASETRISETHLRRILAGSTKRPRLTLFQKIFELYCRECLKT